MIEVARPSPDDDPDAFRRNGANIPITYSWAERLKRDPFGAYYHLLDPATIGLPIRTRLANSMAIRFIRSFESRRSHAGRPATKATIARGFRMLEADDWEAAAHLAYRAAQTGQSSTDQRAINLMEAIQYLVREHDKFAPALQPVAVKLYDTNELVTVRASFTWPEFRRITSEKGYPMEGRQISWEPQAIQTTSTP